MKNRRMTFAKGDDLKCLSHLDFMRGWERLLCCARVPLAYSKGFNPPPRITVAAPLPVGIAGEAEVMDLFRQERAVGDERLPMTSRMPDNAFLDRVGQ